MCGRKRLFSATYTLFFVTLLSVVCSLVLSSLAISLSEKKLRARELDKSEQLLMSARIYNPKGHFAINQGGKWLDARSVVDGRLIPAKTPVRATKEEILKVFEKRVQPMVVSLDGKLKSCSDVGIDPSSYFPQASKQPLSALLWLPIYKVASNTNDAEQDCYVIPINGFGLWDRIAGFLAIEPDGKTVRGISWYEQKETPGLGGVISDPSWQEQFHGKSIFQPDEKGVVTPSRSPLGIKVLKGTVQDTYGASPLGEDAVDGISGATLTGNGVTNAYRSCLEPYRPFFETLAKKG